METHATVASSLSRLSDRSLRGMVDAAPVLGSGIGGTRALLHVDDVPVFVKRVPLTDLEREPQNVMSTANLFDLPMGCHYGVGSPSFGAWRELAANEMTTRWVLAGRSENFPLMYHWRVLDGPASTTPLSEELADIERAVAYWHDSDAVRQRIEAIAKSSATVTMFFEYLPHSLTAWLTKQVEDAGTADGAIAMVEHNLRSGIEFMNATGLFHFDAHFGNVVTDGRRLCLVDFGLATSSGFELSATESSFLRANLSHDRCHTITRFVDWLVTELAGVDDWEARDDYIRCCTDGDELIDLLPSAAAIIRRYAPIAVVMNDFYRRLHLVDRAAPYPVDAIRRAIAASGLGSLN